MNASPWPGVRISDAERTAAVDALGEHFAAGRLTREEYDERADQALAARTAAEVAPLFRDLPAPHPYAPTAPAAPAAPRQARPASTFTRPPQGPSGRRGPRLPFLPLLFVVVGLAVLLKAPWLVFLVLGVLWFSRSRRRGC
jgi:hypothetical protein